jgi:hypothetical protein
MKFINKIAGMALLFSMLLSMTLCPHSHCHEQDGAFTPVSSICLDDLDNHHHGSEVHLCGCLCHINALPGSLFQPLMQLPFFYSFIPINLTFDQIVADRMERPPLS